MCWWPSMHHIRSTVRASQVPAEIHGRCGMQQVSAALREASHQVLQRAARTVEQSSSSSMAVFLIS